MFSGSLPVRNGHLSAPVAETATLNYVGTLARFRAPGRRPWPLPISVKRVIGHTAAAPSLVSLATFGVALESVLVKLSFF